MAHPPVSTAASSIGTGGRVNSNALNFKGSTSVEVSARTGMASLTFPIVALPGKGNLGVNLNLTYQQYNAAGRYEGIAPGWGIGLASYDANSETVYISGGGAYQRAGETLQYYNLKDLSFSSSGGQTPDNRSYTYALSYLDGQTQYLDANGNLICISDRYGNFVRISYSGYNSVTNIAAIDQIVDSYGQTISFAQTSDGNETTLTVTLPSGHQIAIAYIATTKVLTFENPLGQVTSVIHNSDDTVSTITYPTGLQTRLQYTDVLDSSPTLRAVSQLTQYDTRTNLPVMGPTTYDLNPENNDGHNFLGNGICPQSTSNDALLESNNNGYFYNTEVAQGRLITRNTYNHLHLLVEQQKLAYDAKTQTRRLLRSYALLYTGQSPENPGIEPPFAELPPNYQRPIEVTASYFGPEQLTQRDVTVTMTFDPPWTPERMSEEAKLELNMF